MNFKYIPSYYSVNHGDWFNRYEGFFTEKDFQYAFKYGKDFLKHGFYCKTSNNEITTFFVSYRIPTTNINIGLQIVPRSKNTCLVRGLNSLHFLPEDYEELDEYIIDLCNFEGDFENLAFYESVCETEEDLRCALNYFYKEVISFCSDIKTQEKEEFKELCKIIKENKKFDSK